MTVPTVNCSMTKTTASKLGRLQIRELFTTTYGLKSWRYTAAKIWNALPDQFRAANIGTFKNLMSKLDFSNFTL